MCGGQKTWIALAGQLQSARLDQTGIQHNKEMGNQRVDTSRSGIDSGSDKRDTIVSKALAFHVVRQW